jgi:O-methyltransferase
VTHDEAAELYLDLLQRCLTRLAFPAEYRPLLSLAMPVGPLQRIVQPLLAKLNVGLYRRCPIDPAIRAHGKDWPAEAETMVGVERLEMLHRAARTIFAEQVAGDFLEAGTWRGGAAIFMRGILKAYGECARVVWVADSFAGLPKPDARYPQDSGDAHWRMSTVLAVSVAEVRSNFERYGLFDDRVRLVPGWFADTLPRLPVDRLALLRLDGDMYSSTRDALESLYDKVSPGGFVVIDDYGALAVCRRAVDEFRARRGIVDPIHTIDWTGVFWRKQRPAGLA